MSSASTKTTCGRGGASAAARPARQSVSRAAVRSAVMAAVPSGLLLPGRLLQVEVLLVVAGVDLDPGVVALGGVGDGVGRVHQAVVVAALAGLRRLLPHLLARGGEVDLPD